MRCGASPLAPASMTEPDIPQELSPAPATGLPCSFAGVRNMTVVPAQTFSGEQVLVHMASPGSPKAQPPRTLSFESTTSEGRNDREITAFCFAQELVVSALPQKMRLLQFPSLAAGFKTASQEKGSCLGRQLKQTRAPASLCWDQCSPTARNSGCQGLEREGRGSQG